MKMYVVFKGEYSIWKAFASKEKAIEFWMNWLKTLPHYSQMSIDQLTELAKNEVKEIEVE